MSTISIPYIGTLKGIDKPKTETIEKTSTNHDCSVILGLHFILLGIVLVAVMLGPIAMSYYVRSVQVRVKSRTADKRYLVLNKEDFILARNSSRLC